MNCLLGRQIIPHEMSEKKQNNRMPPAAAVEVVLKERNEMHLILP